LNRKLLIFLLAGALLGIIGANWYTMSQSMPSKARNEIDSNAEILLQQKELKEKIPAKVFETLRYVETFHEPKAGYVGGRIFHNYEKLLPLKTADAINIDYQEWDVNPKENQRNRGPERLITGNDKSAWYTSNHYKSFIKIK